ncbi:hypothetical protein BT69DRAFT_1306832, partial [Atractiella rhizophila]
AKEKKSRKVLKKGTGAISAAKLQELMDEREEKERREELRRTEQARRVESHQRVREEKYLQYVGRKRQTDRKKGERRGPEESESRAHHDGSGRNRTVDHEREQEIGEEVREELARDLTDHTHGDDELPDFGGSGIHKEGTATVMIEEGNQAEEASEVEEDIEMGDIDNYIGSEDDLPAQPVIRSTRARQVASAT